MRDAITDFLNAARDLSAFEEIERPSKITDLSATMAARNMSPVEIIGRRWLSASSRPWVPLPTPGGPKRMIRTAYLL